MELFGFSAAKIIVILIIAIIILGPEKVPQMAAQAGKLIRDFRRYMKEITKEFDEATGDLRAEFTAITSDLSEELAAAQAELQQQLNLTAVFDPAESPPAAPRPVATDITPAPAELTMPPREPDETEPLSGAQGDGVPSGDVRMSPLGSRIRIERNVSLKPSKAAPLSDLVVLMAGSENTNGWRPNGTNAPPSAGSAERSFGSDDAPAARRRRVIGRSVTDTAYRRSAHRNGTSPSAPWRTAPRGSSRQCSLIRSPEHTGCGTHTPVSLNNRSGRTIRMPRTCSVIVPRMRSRRDT